MTAPVDACGDTASALLPPERALAAILDAAAPVTGTETLPLTQAAGRVLAAKLHAGMELPPFDQSAMDGYGLTEADLAPDAAPRVVRTIPAGAAPGPVIAPGQAVRVLTGAALPDGVAAVVMEEHVTEQDGLLRMKRRARGGDNIRRRGEDVASGQPLLSPGMRLDARHIALAAAVGATQLTVRRKVRVAVLSNGDELLPPGVTRHPAAIHDSNRPMLLAMLAGNHACALTDLGLLGDDPAALARILREQAEQQDLILSTGGVRGSGADHIPRAILDAGGRVTMLKLRQKPGKPLAHGRLGDAACLCLPGNPLAALAGLLTLGRPLLRHLAGDTSPLPGPVMARAAEAFRRHPGREEFVPASVLRHDADGVPVIGRAGGRGSARLLPLSRADGLLWLPADAAQVVAGQALRFWPFAAAFSL